MTTDPRIVAAAERNLLTVEQYYEVAKDSNMTIMELVEVSEAAQREYEKLERMDEEAFKDVIKNDINDSFWSIHYFLDKDGNNVVVPIGGWKRYDTEDLDDGTCLTKFEFEENIFYDGSTERSIHFKDEEDCLNQLNLFKEHWGK